MLRSISDLRGYSISASDGEIGSVEDFYFDDEAWAVRYLVVDTGKWLPGRQVLISPIAIGEPDWVSRRLGLSLTRDRVKNSPPIDTAKPVSRQKEAEHFAYYGYPAYWNGAALWGPGAYPLGAPIPAAVPVPPAQTDQAGDAENHLRSAREVIGYNLQATDGELGRVDDFLVDDADWAIRYVVVATGKWWTGRKTLVPPEWMDAIDWTGRDVHVSVTQDAVRNAPTYDAVAHVNRQWEADYYAHHKREPYWTSGTGARRINARRGQVAVRKD